MTLTPTQRKNLVPLVLFLANLVFLFIGGLIFESIEYKPRKEHSTSDDVALFLQTLKKTSQGKRIFPEHLDIKEAVEGLKSDSLEKIDAKFDEIRKRRTAASKPSWSFSNSLFFATTVVTTIGKAVLNVYVCFHAYLGYNFCNFLANYCNETFIFSWRWFSEFIKSCWLFWSVV